MLDSVRVGVYKNGSAGSPPVEVKSGRIIYKESICCLFNS